MLFKTSKKSTNNKGSIKQDKLDLIKIKNWDFPGGPVVRIHLPMQRTWVSSLVRKDPTYCWATKPVPARVPWIPCATTREAAEMRSLLTTTKETCIPQPEKTHALQ